MSNLIGQIWLVKSFQVGNKLNVYNEMNALEYSKMIVWLEIE